MPSKRLTKAGVFRSMESPVGVLTLVGSDAGLTAVLWPGDSPRRVPTGVLTEDRDEPLLLETERQLGEYFAGRRTAFDVPLDLVGTDFQQAVWRALVQIPYGQTRSYGQIARTVGCPRAVRAVGAANGRNPISIIIPCHRVVGASGDLTGFAGGLAAKIRLLAIEGRPDGETAAGRSRKPRDWNQPSLFADV